MAYPGPPDPQGDPYRDPYSDPQQGYPGGLPPESYGQHGQMQPYQPPPHTPQTGGWQALPGSMPPPGGGGPPLAVLGDITVTQTEVITPSGSFPLSGSQWSINDMTHVEQKMATWGLVLALIGFFVVCVFSLFFLLAKETVVHGGIQISVRSGQHYHTVMVPVHSMGQAQQIHQQFNYVRSMATSS